MTLVQDPIALEVAATADLPDVQALAPARRSVLRRLARDKAAAAAALFLATVGLMAIFAPFVAPYDPYFTDLAHAMQPPNATHWAGTDTAGRDLLSRLIYGSRHTLLV